VRHLFLPTAILAISLCSPVQAQTGNSAPMPGDTMPGDNWQPLLADFTALAQQQLAAALSRAYAAHIDNARPLPADVQQFLRGILPDEIIARARFTVSNDATTLPGLLNQGHRAYMQQDNAVSIDNLIIFSREPTFASGTDARWWAHELGHHLQYRQLGSIEGFAREYVLSFQKLEADAERYGEQALRKYVALHR
jgi:hypothetical protein